MVSTSQAPLQALTDEQQMLVSVCDRIAEDYGPSPATRDVDPPRDAWATVVDIGLPVLTLDPASGGSGAAFADLTLVVERFARSPLELPVIGTAIGSLALEAVGASSDGRAEEALGELVNGRPGSLVLSGGLDHLERDEDPAAFDWVPGSLAVSVADGQVWVTSAGAECESVDLTRRLGAHLEPFDPVGTAAPEATLGLLARALVLLSADLVGTMDGALDQAVAHAREREQFGRPIGSFQAVQQLCADQLVTIAGARSITRAAAEALDTATLDEALHLARVAKAYCSEHALTVCEAAIQVWGGIGMTWECPAHLFLRRALLSRRALGDEHAQLDALVDHHLFTPAGAH
jgi:alkylation response protein AidB-like acyl-CoA dehydrogenase